MNLLINNTFLFFIFISSSFYSAATTCESTIAGTWDSNIIWDCGAAPSDPGNCVDTIVIGEHTYIDEHVDLSGCPPIVLIVNDTLLFKAGKKLYLPDGSEVIMHVGGYLVGEGGGGNSNVLDIGNTTFWRTGDGTLTGASSLDIELIGFYATQYETSIQLHWITASEINNDFFTIERSRDGMNFESIGDINGAGNSSTEIDYSFLDNNVFNGIIYYRLKQTDFDGSSTYSPIIKVVTIGENEIMEVFPNPTNGKLTLRGSQTELSEIGVYNMLGENITAQVFLSKGDGNVVFDLSELTNGMYVIKTKTLNTRVVKE